MKRLLAWAVFTAALAACLHVMWFWYLPRMATRRVVDAIFERQPSWRINQLGHAPLRVAGSDVVVRDNPDTVTSFAVYDVSALPIRVHCVLPETDSYWSLSLFAWNTDNFFVVNDRNVDVPALDLVLVKSGSLYEALPDEKVVVSPSQRGILIVRMTVTDRDDLGELERIRVAQLQSFIQPIEGVLY